MSPLIFLSSGEASGDYYGAELIALLKRAIPAASFTGLGGTLMEQQGQQRVIRAEDVAVMGVTEILKHIPRILLSYRQLVSSIHAKRPDVAVLIDFPDVNFRLAKHLRRMGVPVIWFVSPQLWAWKRRRLRWVQQRVSKMLCIFPFEQAFYAARGVEAEFVGHPLAEQPLPSMTREAYAAQWTLNPTRPWIALLPGSRGGEIAANLPEMLRAAALLGPTYEYLLPMAPTLGKHARQTLDTLGATHTSVRLVRDARAALQHSRAAIVASGTATVQAAVLGNPFVVVYKVSKLTFAAAKRLVCYPAEILSQEDEHGNLPIAMVNLVAGCRVVPEFLQKQFTAANIVAALKPLLEEGPERQAQIEALSGVRKKLQSPTGQPGIERLRDAVLIALNGGTSLVSAPDASASNDQVARA
ncbi:MAG: lipid-A-disaccharide synthase [Janthinobacterium lividum]